MQHANMIFGIIGIIIYNIAQEHSLQAYLDLCLLGVEVSSQSILWMSIASRSLHGPILSFVMSIGCLRFEMSALVAY